MSLLLATAIISASVIPSAEIDLTSPAIYISEQARAGIADGTVARLACLDLPKRSRKYRTACLTPAEWDKAAQESKRAGDRSRTAEELNGLPFSQGPSQLTGYESAGGPR